MKVEIDQESCAGTGYCRREAPELFELIDHKSHLREGVDPNSVDPKRVHAAADACPWRAITIEP